MHSARAEWLPADRAPAMARLVCSQGELITDHVIVDDISGMATHHLDNELHLPHGVDQGGAPERGVGGDDAMRFRACDPAFGPDACPDVDLPASIVRSCSRRSTVAPWTVPNSERSSGLHRSPVGDSGWSVVPRMSGSFDFVKSQGGEGALVRRQLDPDLEFEPPDRELCCSLIGVLDQPRRQSLSSSIGRDGELSDVERVRTRGQYHRRHHGLTEHPRLRRRLGQLRRTQAVHR